MTLSGATTLDESETGSDGNEKGYSAFSKAPALLNIRLFRIISRTLVGGVLPSAEKQSVYSRASTD